MAYETGAAYVPVLPSFRYFQKRVRAEVARMPDVDLKVTPDVRSAKAQAALKELEKPRQVKIDADIAKAKAKIEEITASRNAAVVHIDADISKAKERIEELEGKRGKTKIDVDAEIVKAQAKIAQLEAKRNTVMVQADADTAVAQSKLSQVGRQAAALNGRRTSLHVGLTGAERVMLMLGAVTTAAAGAAAVLPAVGAAGVGSLGALGGSAFGVVKALTAYNQAQDAATTSAGAGAAAAVSQAIAMRNASQAVSDARKAQSRAIEDAEASIASAERGVAQAQGEALRAQRAVNEARADALRNLEDLAERVSDYALSEKEAQLALREAQENQAKANKEYAEGSIERAKADLAVEQAQERLSDLDRDRKRDTEALAEAQKAGVEGSKGVVSAREAEQAANERVADAERSLQQAKQQAARSQEDAAVAVARALQGVADAQDRAATSSTGADTAARKYEEALAKLSPTGKLAVQQLLSMEGGARNFQHAMQEATLPGFIDFLEGISSAEGPITRGMAASGEAISNVGTRAGDLLKSPLFQGRLEMAFKNSAPIIEAVGDGVLDLTDKVVTFGAQSTDVTEGSVKAIEGLFAGLGSYYDELTPHAEGVGRTLESLGTLSESLLGALGELFGQATTGYGSIADQVEGFVERALDSITDFTGSGVDAFSEGVGVIVDALDTVNTLLKPFMDFLGGAAGNIVGGLFAWKLLSGAIGGVGSAMNNIRPDVVSKKINDSKLGQSLQTVGTVAVDTGNKVDDAGKKADGASGKFKNIGSKALESSKYIPLIGVALAALESAYDEFIPSADTVAASIAKGGEAAVKAKEQMYDNKFDGTIFDPFLATSAEVQGEVDKIRSKWTELEWAEYGVTQAQYELTEAQRKYGKESPEAVRAAGAVEFSVGKLRDRQWEAERATRSHTEKLQEQQRVMIGQVGSSLNYQNSVIGVTTAQQRLAEVTADVNATETERKQAQIELQQAMLGSIEAAGTWQESLAAGLPPTEQAIAKTNGMNTEIARLAVEAGTNAPAALQTLMANMSESERAALGVTTRVDETGRTIYELPPGKRLEFPTDAAQAAGKVKDLKNAVVDLDTTYGRFMDKYLNDIGVLNNQPGNQNPFPLPIPGFTPNFHGNLIEAYANGGMRPMEGGVAKIVPPNSLRVIGDRVTDDELYLPLNNSPRSEALLAEGAARMGKAVVPMAEGGVLGFASGGVAATSSTSSGEVGAPIGALSEDADAATVALVALQAATEALTSTALTPLGEVVTSATVPAFEAVELHAGTMTVQALTALGAQLPILQGGFNVTAGVLTAAMMQVSTSGLNTTNAMIGHFNVLKQGLTSVGQAFDSTAAWVAAGWSKIMEAAAAPTRWVLHNPINAGIIAAWNKLNADFALGKAVSPVGVGFSGGGYTGDGGMYEPKGVVHGGEFVVRKKITRKAMPFLDALNRGEAEALQAAGVRGYATGGLVADTGSQLNAAIVRGLQFAKDQDGKPYIWGGVGPQGYDCSGFQSAITNVLVGRNPHKRLFSTASFAGGPTAGFAPGLNSAYGIGVSQGNPGHMAGTLAGSNVESGGSPSKVKFVAGAAGATSPQFSARYHLPVVGGTFVDGGGGGFDPTPIVNGAFENTYKMIGQIATMFSGVLPGQLQGISTQAADGVKSKALEKLTSVMGATGGAGSPEVVAAVKAVAAKYGWHQGAEWDALSKLIQGESSWNPSAANPTSSARGLFQKMTSLHGPIEPTPAGQAEWGLSYIKRAYGSPSSAYGKWLSRSPHWYDSGGMMQPGGGTFYNGTSKPEPVLTSQQWRDISILAGRGATAETTNNINISPRETPEAYAVAVTRHLAAANRLA